MECLQLHEFKELPQAAFLMTPQPLRLGEHAFDQCYGHFRFSKKGSPQPSGLFPSVSAVAGRDDHCVGVSQG